MEIYNIMDSLECKSHFSRKVIMCDKSHIFHQNMIVQSMYTKNAKSQFGSTIPPTHWRQASSLDQFEVYFHKLTLKKSSYFHWQYY